MAVATHLAELLLVTMFLLSAVTKLTGMPQFRSSLSDFGVPSRLIPAAGYVVAVSEVSIATLLLFPETVVIGLLLSLFVLGVFTSAILYHIVRGRRPHCRCFGAVDDRPIGPVNVGRNIVFMAVALFALWVEIDRGPLGAMGWLRPMSPLERTVVLSITGLVAVAVIQGWLLLYLLRQYGRLLHVLPTVPGSADETGLPLGSQAPQFAVTVGDGVSQGLDSFCAMGLPVVLAFSSPDCHYCADILDDYRRFSRDNSDFYHVLVVSSGGSGASTVDREPGDIFLTATDEGRSIRQRYGIPVVPAAVVVSPSGHIESETAVGVESIRGLLASISVSTRSDAAASLIVGESVADPLKEAVT